MSEISLFHGDCLEIMKLLPDKSVDMVLCDLPYSTTKCSWDIQIPFAPLWEQYRRITKINAAICLFGREPFSSSLRMSNIKMYRYDWIWQKTKPQGFLNAKRQPLRSYENISVFYEKAPYYDPQGTVVGNFNTDRKAKHREGVYNDMSNTYETSSVGNYPRDIIKFSNLSGKGHLHPTQKPVDLCEYLIRTYTAEGMTVLDNCMGSGTTGVACRNINRGFIGIELDSSFFGVAENRIFG